MDKKRFVLAYELDQLPEVISYREVHPGAQVVCLDFWVERELKRKNVDCISLQDFLPAEDTEEEWWILAQKVAREWYRLPAMAFFEYEGIRIGEALEPMMEMYLSRLFYYVRIAAVLKEKYPEAHIHIPTSFVGDASSAGPLISFEQWAVADAFRMAGLENTVQGERVAPPKHIFPRMVWKSLLVRAYNMIVGFAPRRSLKIYASEYWSHIAPIIEQMSDTELVLMEGSELKKIPWRHILKHRIRIRHPADAVKGALKRRAQEQSSRFLQQWAAGKDAVGQFLITEREGLDWHPVLDACEYLVAYSSRVIADIDAFKNILQEEKPNVVLQRASIGGRQHHFFLMARIAARFKIPSIELQHAGAEFNPRSVHSRLETSYLAAYGEVEREEYVRNGYRPEQIIPIGSPRFDAYRLNAERLSKMRKETLHSIGLDPTRPVVMAAVPAQQSSLSPVLFSSYDIATYFREMRNAWLVIPETQFLFKFRQRNCHEHHRAYLRELFPEGGIAMADGDPFPLICASDGVISGNSTIVYETMISRRPLVLFPWKKWDYSLDLYSAVAPYARSGIELAQCLKKDESYARENAMKEQSFMERHVFDGHSATRVAALLHEDLSAIPL